MHKPFAVDCFANPDQSNNAGPLFDIGIVVFGVTLFSLRVHKDALTLSLPMAGAMIPLVATDTPGLSEGDLTAIQFDPIG